MKNQYLYLIIVLVVLVIAALGWYFFSSTAQVVASSSKYTRWSCTDTQAYSCPGGTSRYICSNGVLSCFNCTTTPNRKDYKVTLNAVGYQGPTLSGVFTVNNETLTLGGGQTWTLSDGTIFGVTTLLQNYSAFYLQSSYETKSSWLIAPYPKSTTISLIVSQTETCNPTIYSCTNWYVPSCSGSALICSQTSSQCSLTQPGTNCTAVGTCSGGGGGGRPV